MILFKQVKLIARLNVLKIILSNQAASCTTNLYLIFHVS